MAQIHPDFYTIQHLHQPATEGELILLDFLQKNLNMEFEIYYHPFINGDRPNIVILKKGCGAIIISVNDWDLTDYAMMIWIGGIIQLQQRFNHLSLK